jgi:hypothetical protein
VRRSSFLKGAVGLAVLAKTDLSALADRLAPASTGTTITVVDGSAFHAADIIRNFRTGEAMLVTSVRGNTLEVVRGIGSLAPQPIKSEHDIIYVASAVPEGGDLR